jgi:trehalose-6-phosphate synthase
MFARAASRSVPARGITWVHDFHLALVPRMLRSLRPSARIATFWHIPFPAPAVFGVLPWAREIVNGNRTEDAFSRFEVLERRADFAEGRADALGMTGPKSLEEEIAELRASESVDAELEAMKAALAAKGK